MAALQEIEFTNNTGMSGGLPSTIGQLGQLQYLRFKNTGLSGNIPEGFSDLVNLKIFEASNNNLDGSIPSTARMSQLGRFSRCVFCCNSLKLGYFLTLHYLF